MQTYFYIIQNKSLIVNLSLMYEIHKTRIDGEVQEQIKIMCL